MAAGVTWWREPGAGLASVRYYTDLARPDDSPVSSYAAGVVLDAVREAAASGLGCGQLRAAHFSTSARW